MRSVCGNTETVSDVNSRWKTKTPTWYFRGNLLRIPVDATVQLMQVAVEMWNSKCGLQSRMWRPGDGGAPDIVIDSVRIDGRNGVLADMELPDVRDPSQRRMRLDISEDFVISNNPPDSKISLRHVFEHEFGHAIGLPHGGRGRMEPSYNLTDPLDAWSIAEAIERYGPPSAVEPGPPPDPPTDIEDIVLEINGEITIKRKGG